MHSRENKNNIIDGFVNNAEQFKKRYYGSNSTFFADLVKNGQRPKVLLIACCDSRPNPTDILGIKPGEAFIVRKIANIIPPYDPDHHDTQPNSTTAALEFGMALEVEHIIIMAHSFCGGIAKLLENTRNHFPPQNQSSVDAWVNLAKETSKQVLKEHANCAPEEQAKICEEQVLLMSLKNLLTYPWVKARQDQLSLHAWRFDMASGNLQAYQPDTGKFEVLSPTTATQKAKL